MMVVTMVGALATFASLLVSAVLGHPVTHALEQRPTPPIVSPFQARVTAVSDGDTLIVRALDGNVHRVRIDGVDCPESGQAFSQVARNFTRQLAFDRQVSVRIVTTDRNGRLVSRVSVDGKDLGIELVRAGLAWHYTEFSADKELAALEQVARAAKRGLWADSNPIPPWVWRRSKQPASSEVERTRAVEGPFRANIRSRVYHAPTCRNYRCQNCTAEFRTAAEAEAAGYRPAGDCIRGGR
jgi:micrococcal nuclease